MFITAHPVQAKNVYAYLFCVTVCAISAAKRHPTTRMLHTSTRGGTL